VFLYDFVTHAVTRVSVDGNGHELPNGANGGLSINASGDAATFLSGDAKPQVYVHYRASRTTMLVSIGNSHQPGNDGSGSPSISPSGTVVAFSSLATNLVPGVHGVQIYARDLGAGNTFLVSATSGGKPGNGASSLPATSATGIVFASGATNLTGGSTGGHDQLYFRSR
jgi:Tol biopolymer transport system component